MEGVCTTGGSSGAALVAGVVRLARVYAPLMVTGRDLVIRVMGKAHGWLLRISNGRLGSRMANGPILLLVTTGRRSGKERTNALLYIKDDSDFVVTATNAGQDHAPGWYFNLQSTPQAIVEVGGERVAVRASEVHPPESEDLWDRLVAIYGGYSGYRQRTSRPIPIIRLVPSSS